MFVTHDIDEAVRLGDRIAVFSVGGRLEQYDTPATILGAPATEFVADFVGADRGLRRLAVTPIDPADLEHPPTVSPSDALTSARSAIERAPEPYAVVVDEAGRLRGWIGLRDTEGAGTGSSGTVGERLHRFDETADVGDSLRRALAEIVQHDAGWLPVVDDERYLGVLTPTSVHHALRRSLPQTATV